MVLAAIGLLKNGVCRYRALKVPTATGLLEELCQPLLSFEKNGACRYRAFKELCQSLLGFEKNVVCRYRALKVCQPLLGFEVSAATGL